jgi:hypothetical protein
MMSKNPITLLNSYYVEYIYEMTARSPHIATNPMYKAIVDKMQFHYEANDLTINAYAWMDADGIPHTAMLKGFTAYSLLVSYAMGMYSISNDLSVFNRAMHTITNEVENANYDITLEVFQNIQTQLNLVDVDVDAKLLGKIESFYTGLIMHVIAHELGHNCLGHCARDVDLDIDITRNNERQADLFASNVIQTTMFKDFTVISALFVEIMFMWLSPDYEGNSTHPGSRERVYNVLKSFEYTLKDYGITEKNIDLLLP